MISAPPIRAILVLLSVLVGGCATTTIYTMDPVAQRSDDLTRDQLAVTQSKDGVTVTVGPVAALHGDFLTFGILVTNTSKRSIRTAFGDVRIAVNERPVTLTARAEIQKEAESLKKQQAIAGGLSAASVSLADSQARAVATARAREEGRSMPTQSEVDRARNPMPELAESVVKLSEAAAAARIQAGTQEADRLAATSNSMAWDNTRTVRKQILDNPAVTDMYYWRGETIPPGVQVLRAVRSERGVSKQLAGKEAIVTVELLSGQHTFAYRFRAIPRSFGEAISESKKRDFPAPK